MSRPGISYADVAAAANSLMDDGINPTIEQIRRKLGTGSSTTISNHLRDWKNRESNTAVASIKEAIPQDLVGVVKGLWERVVDQSEEKIQSVEAEAEKKLESLEIDLQKYRHNNRRWQKLFYKWQNDKAELDTRLQQMEELIAQQQQEIQTLSLDNKVLQGQLLERNQQVKDLRDDQRNRQEHYNKIYTQLQDQYQKECREVILQRDQQGERNVALISEIQQLQHMNALLTNECVHLQEDTITHHHSQMKESKDTYFLSELKTLNQQLQHARDENRSLQMLLQKKQHKETV